MLNGYTPDHPVIRNLERTGHPTSSAPVERQPVCPMCDRTTDTFYKTVAGEIAGCDRCIRAVDAWDEQENERSNPNG